MIPPPSMREHNFSASFDVLPRWITQRGEALLPQEFQDTHLRNALRFAFCNARGFVAREAGWAWDFYVQTRGEMAEYYAGQDADRLDELMLSGTDEEVRRWLRQHPLIKAMLREHSKRKREGRWNP